MGGKGEMTKAPISLQDLRRSLYVKAKAEPTWRFWVMRASKRKGMGWKRWSREGLYDRVGLFNDYRRVRLPQFSKANPIPNVP